MKILNKLAEMQKPDNFIKTIEIRKVHSLDDIIGNNYYSEGWKTERMTIWMESGLLYEDMYITDYNHLDCSRINDNCVKCAGTYKLVFDGYQRVKVSRLFDDIKKDYYMSWCYGQTDWMRENIDFIKDYLKDEEYCLVLMVNKEETFKANGWEEHYV